MASGQGSNFEVIAKNFEVSLLITNKECNALKIAEQLNVNCKIIADQSELLKTLKQEKPDLICLAGYMKIVNEEIINCFENKMINLHPSLLPAYRGLHAFEKSFNANEPILGATIHYVDAGLDTGKIIKQEHFKNNYNEEDMQRNLKQVEHKLFIDVIKNLIEEFHENSVN